MWNHRTWRLHSAVMVTLHMAIIYELRAAGDYSRDQVLSINIMSQHDASKLEKIFFSRYSDHITHWTTQQSSGFPQVVDIHVTASVAGEVKQVLIENEVTFITAIEDLKGLIIMEKMELKKLKRTKRSSDDQKNKLDVLLGLYPDYDEITEWLQNLTSSFPQLVSLQSLGKTYENRDILLLKISQKGSDIKRPGFWIDSGIHAREWITVSSSVYIIVQLLEAMTGSCPLTSKECNVISSFDWHMVPVVNPDGYAFSHKEDRLWRKNRSKVKDQGCVGVDLNRNFDVDWGKRFTSNNSCSEIYGGPHAGSENETNSLTSYWTKNKNSLHAWVTLHSYGQLLMNRWSHFLANDTQEYNETLSVLKKAASAIFNSTGSTYKVGSSPEVLYSFSGGSGDWFRRNTSVKHVYDLELRDRGNHSFILPLTEILPTAHDAHAAVMTIASEVLWGLASVGGRALKLDLRSFGAIVLLGFILEKNCRSSLGVARFPESPLVKRNKRIPQLLMLLSLMLFNLLFLSHLSIEHFKEIKDSKL